MPDAIQSFTLTVSAARQAPAFTSADHTTFTVGSQGSFTVTATGSPTPTLSVAGALPSGVTFDPNTGALSGTPAAGTEGSYPIGLTAANGVSPDAIQSFTLTVSRSKQATGTIVSGSPNPSFVGQLVAFTATVSASSGMPTGTVTFAANGSSLGSSTLNNGQATLNFAFPAAGNYTITATYQGGDSFLTSTGTTTQTVATPTPRTSPNERYVQHLYQDLLERGGEVQGVDYWVSQLDGGANRANIVFGFQRSPEFWNVTIANVYKTTLSRMPDASGYATFRQLLASGGSARQIEVAVQSSPEYFLRRGGATQPVFLSSVFADWLARTPDPSAEATLLPLLNAGYPRFAVAAFVAFSLEGNQHYLQTLYSSYLHRQVDYPASQGWLDLLSRGDRDNQVIAGILASDEYYQLSQM